MLHTRTTQPNEPPVPFAQTPRVRCRARTWHVLDRHDAGTGVTWRLVRGAEMPRLIASPPDEVVTVPIGVRRVSRRAWARAALSHARAHTPTWWPATATSLPLVMMAWQFVPAMMMLSGHHRRVLLADEVGMGKTIQAGILLHEVHAREPDAATLVVVPAGLVAQWAAELRMRVQLEVSVLDALALRVEAAHPQRVVDAARAGTCWLMSMDLLRQADVIALVARTRWTLLVVDEAHACAPGTSRLDAVSRVASASVRVLLLTATPTAAGSPGADRLRAIGGRLGEAPMGVVRRETSLLTRPRRRTRVIRIGLGEAHLSLCRRLDRFVERARHDSGARGLLPAFVLRRRASSCPAALVRSLERRLEVLGDTGPTDALLPGLLEPAVLLESQDARDDEVMRVGAWLDEREERTELERLLALARQLPPAGRKLEAVARLIRRCGQPVVVFTSFLDTLRALRDALGSRGVAIVHGEQPDALRTQALEAFTDGDANVLLTTDASAEGLNLHARCRLVVHAEVPASLRAFEQRNGRLDRYGQSRRVHAVVMSSDTVEDRDALLRLQTRAAGDDSWLSAAVPPRCRRTAVAMRTLAALAPGTRSGTDARVDQPCVGRLHSCVLHPRRWRRFAARLGLPSDALCVWTATLRASGGPELSAWRMPTSIVGQAGAVPWATHAASWLGPLRGHLLRARRLARRLGSWEHDATIAARREAAGKAPDLFTDGMEPPSTADGYQPSEHVCVTLEPTAVIACRGLPSHAAVRSHAIGLPAHSKGSPQ